MKVPTPSELAKLIDHTFLKPDGTREMIDKLCVEAKEYGFALVAVNPSEVSRCVSLLNGCSTRVGAAIGFPLGQNTVATKLFEVEDSIKRGAGEIDMVINQRAVRAGDFELIRDEIFDLADICRQHRVISKIILECCNLTDGEKIAICEIASEAKCNFVKTSTGFGAHGATVHDVKLMKQHVLPGVEVKAAGGIRSLDAALEMLDAGATRLGTSAGVTIVQEFSNKQSIVQESKPKVGNEY